MAQEIEKYRGCYVPKRYILTLLSFFGMFSLYAMRVNLSVAMVAMINSTDSNATNKSRIVECSMHVEPQQSKTGSEFKGAQYNWDSETEGLILGAFFYGYVITQVPGGSLAEKFGAKWIFGGSVLGTSVLTLLTPLAASSGTTAFVVLRILEGFVSGVAFPSMNFIISQWSPLLERSRVSTIIFAGAEIGNVVSLSMSGWLSSTDLLGGWPSVFYVSGTFGCIWFVFWAILVYDSPAVHPSISDLELAFFQLNGEQVPLKKPKTPWKSIFTSLPMWGTLIAHFGHDFGHSVYLIELPNYMSSILHFNIKENGALSALPYIMQVLLACVASCIADKLRSSGTLGITTIRKLLNTIGLIGPAICMLCITVIGCRPELIVFLLTLSMGLNGFIFSGFHITNVDMSPSFAGTLYGIANTVANLTGVIVPAVVGAVTADEATIRNWNKVFYITSAAYVGGAISYLLLASAELQAWDTNEEENTTEAMKSEDHSRSKQRAK